MSTTTEYARVTFKARTFVGRQSRDGIGAKNGVRLVRVTEDGRDDLRVSGPGFADTWEVPWSNIASGVQARQVPAPVRGSGEPDNVESAADDEPEPKPAAKAKKGRR